MQEYDKECIKGQESPESWKTRILHCYHDVGCPHGALCRIWMV